MDRARIAATLAEEMTDPSSEGDFIFTMAQDHYENLPFDDLVRQAQEVLYEGQLKELGVPADPPALTEGDAVLLRFPHGVSGVDESGAEHTLSADDLASTHGVVRRVSCPDRDRGWQYAVVVLVENDDTDRHGNQPAITVTIDDTNRDADGRLPIERVAAPVMRSFAEQLQARHAPLDERRLDESQSLKASLSGQRFTPRQQMAGRSIRPGGGPTTIRIIELSEDTGAARLDAVRLPRRARDSSTPRGPGRHKPR